MYYLTVLLFLLSYEAIMWGWTLNRHATWLKNHPEMDRRKPVSYTMLRVASGMSSMLSISVWCWWIFVMMNIDTMRYSKIHMICPIVVASIQLSHIHFSALIARYSCLPRSMWPLLSKGASILLVKYVKLDPPPLTSCDVHRCWSELSSMRKKLQEEVKS